MLLSDISEKILYVNETPKAVCKGVGISLKNFTVKYLLCSAKSHTRADFCVNVSALEYVDAHAVVVNRMRPVFPKSCAKLFLSLPVFTADGAFLGRVSDVELQSVNGTLTATRIFTDKNTVYSALGITACLDALILKREMPYPIGQRIPAPAVLHFSPSGHPIVGKSTLKDCIEKNRLIHLTLSLPPFSLHLS